MYAELDYQPLVVKLDGLSEAVGQEFLKNAAAVVCERAKELCPKSGNAGSGALAASISIRPVEDGYEVYTPLEYAWYVHQGTGIYNVDGNGRQTWWVYVLNGDPSFKDTGRKEPYYTYEDALQAMAVLQSQGIDAHISQGIQPTPFLTGALEQMKPVIMEKLKEQLKEAGK